MSTIQDFRIQALAAFPRVHWFNVRLDQGHSDSEPKFRICVIVEAEDPPIAGAGSNATDAISRCKSNIAQHHADKIEAARKLLDSIA